MRRTILSSVVGLGVAMIVAAPARAISTTRYPYCLQGRSSPGWSNCNFASWAQCRVMVQGRRLNCVANPFYRGHHR